MEQKAKDLADQPSDKEVAAALRAGMKQDTYITARSVGISHDDVLGAFKEGVDMALYIAIFERTGNDQEAREVSKNLVARP